MPAHMDEAILKIFEIELLQGLLKSTTITAAEERQNRKSVHRLRWHEFTEDPATLFTTGHFHMFSPWASEVPPEIWNRLSRP